MVPKIVLTHKIPDVGLSKLTDTFELVIIEELAKKNQQDFETVLIKEIENADYLVSLLSDDINAQLIEQANQLKLIAQYAVGYNNIDIAVAKKRNILISNTPGVLTNATADLTWALILAASRRIVEGHGICSSGADWAWRPEFLLGNDLSQKTIGIIGMGRIGQAVARRASGFEMNVIYYSRSRKKDLEEKYSYEFRLLNDLLSEADVITLHLPYTTETHHLIDEKEFSLMKRSAILVNTARGKVINEKALIKALKEKRIMACGLDVFYDEPIIPIELRSLSNVVMTPHIGSATYETRDAMALMVADNILAVEKGEKPPNLIPELL